MYFKDLFDFPAAKLRTIFHQNELFSLKRVKIFEIDIYNNINELLLYFYINN